MDGVQGPAILPGHDYNGTFNGERCVLSYISSTLTQGEQIVKEGKFPWIYTFVAWFCLLTVILSPVWLGMVIYRRTTEIALTNRRLILKKGWIARTTDEINLNRLEEVNLQQPVLGRILNYGKLVCKGTGAGEIKFPTIAKPVEFRKLVQEAQFRQQER